MVRRFINCTSGSYTVVTAILAVPLILVVGGAIDLAAYDNKRGAIQNALDAAVLSGVAKMPDEAAARDAAQAYFASNDRSGLTASFIVEDDGSLAGTAIGAVDSAFLTLIGMRTLDVLLHSAATSDVSANGLELAMVLDISGSMKKDMPALKDSAADLVATIYGEDQFRDDVYISIVPFSGRVNIAEYGASWMASPASDDAGSGGSGPGNNGNGNGHGPGGRHGNGKNGGGGQSGGGVGGNWDECPAYEPEVPPLCTGLRSGGRHETAATPMTELFPSFGGDLETCPVSQAVGLTGDRAALDGAIAGLCSSHGTSTHVGMVWGWRALSPDWQGLWGDPNLPLSYEDTPGKYAVIMTDGENNPGQAGDSLSRDQADQQLLRECAAMRAEGITIYAITFGMGGALTDLYQRCTGSAEQQFAAESAEELREAFKKVGSSIASSSIRLIR